MLAPLMKKPGATTAAPSRGRAPTRTAEHVRERRLEHAPGARAAPQPGPHFPSNQPPAAPWALSNIPVYPHGRTKGADRPGGVAAVRAPAATAGKLKVGAANDPREREAERVAERVMRAPDPAQAASAGKAQAGAKHDSHAPQHDHRPAKAGPHEEDHRKAKGSAHPAAGEAPAGVHDVLGEPGKPLDAGSRAFFEPRLGRDLASVRVHDDKKAAQSASSIDAHAYAAGEHVVLGEGQHPATPRGKQVLAHELTHVAQQEGEARTVRRFPIHRPTAADAKPVAPKKSAAQSAFDSYADLFNGFQELAADATNRGGAGLDSARLGSDLSAAHRALLSRVRTVLIEAQERDMAQQAAAAAAWPALAAKLLDAVAEGRRLHLSGEVMAAVTDDIAILGREYVHAKAGKTEPEVESVGDYADSVNGMNDLLWIFRGVAEGSDGLLREQVPGRKDQELSSGILGLNAEQRAALGKVTFGKRLNARHAKMLDALRAALLLARSEAPGSAYKALVLWKSIEGDLKHVLARAQAFDLTIDAGIPAEFETAAKLLAAHYEAVHRENVGVALTKPRTAEAAKAERQIAKAAPPAFSAVMKEAHAVEDFQYAVTTVEQHLAPSKDNPSEWILTSGDTVIRVRADQALALHVVVAEQLRNYMGQLVKGMVRVWETYDSIQRGNSPFKLAVLGGWGGATDPGDQSHFKDSLIRMRDQKVYPLIAKGKYTEAFKWIMVQKGVVDRQAKEVGDYDSDLDVGYSRLAIAASVVQVALTALVPVAGEAALAGGASVLAVGGTAVAAGGVAAGGGELARQSIAGEERDWGKVLKTTGSGVGIALSAVGAPVTKGISNFIAPGATGVTALAANTLASGTFGGVQSLVSGDGFGGGFAGGSFGSLAGSLGSKALGSLAENPLVKTALVGLIGAGVGELTDTDPTIAALGAITASLIEGGGSHGEPTKGAGAKGAKRLSPGPEPRATPEPVVAGLRPPAEPVIPGGVKPPTAPLELPASAPVARTQPPAEPLSPAGARPSAPAPPPASARPPVIAPSQAAPLRGAYTPITEEAFLAGKSARDRARRRARPFNAKDPPALPGQAAPADPTEAARRDFRSIKPGELEAHAGREIDKLASPKQPASPDEHTNTAPEVSQALEGGAIAKPPPGRVTQAAERVVRQAMDDAGITKGKDVPSQKGRFVGGDLHERVDKLWSSQPELAGVEHYSETQIGRLLRPDSPLRNMTVRQFLESRGERELIRRLSGRNLASKIVDLEVDLFAKLPDGSAMIWDLEARDRPVHLAKTLLYAQILSQEGVLMHVGETYWRTFNGDDPPR